MGLFICRAGYFMLVIEVEAREIARLLTLFEWKSFLFFTFYYLFAEGLLISDVDKFWKRTMSFGFLFKTGSSLRVISPLDLLPQQVVDTFKTGSFFNRFIFFMWFLFDWSERASMLSLLQVRT